MPRFAELKRGSPLPAYFALSSSSSTVVATVLDAGQRPPLSSTAMMAAEFTVSPGMRNFSRPLLLQHTTERDPFPVRPPRSPLRSQSGMAPQTMSPSTPQQRRRSRSIGALMAASQQPLFDMHSPITSTPPRARMRTYSSGAAEQVRYAF